MVHEKYTFLHAYTKDHVNQEVQILSSEFLENRFYSRHLSGSVESCPTLPPWFCGDRDQPDTC